MKEFDPTDYDEPRDVAVAFVEAAERVAKLRDQLAKVTHELAHEDDLLGKLDRWLLAIFESNPDRNSIKVIAPRSGHEIILVPDVVLGITKIIEPSFSVHLQMVPFPVEPDADDDWTDEEIDCGSHKMSPFGLVAAASFHDDQAVS